MKEHNNIDDLFKDAFDGFSVLPDDSIKSAIDKHLFEKKSKRRFGFWLFFSGIAFGLTAGTYYFVANNQTEPSNSTTGTQHLASNNSTIKKIEESTRNVETETKISKNALLTETETEKEQERAIIKTDLSATYKQSKKKRSESMNHSTPLNLVGGRSEASLLNLSKNASLIGVLKVKNRNLRLDERTNQLELIVGNYDSVVVAPMERNSKNKVQQSITAFVNYSYESTTSRNTPQNYDDFEMGTIKISGIEARIEYKRSISNSFALNAGVGYGNYSLHQKGNLTTWDSNDSSGWITSDTLPPIYTPSHYSDELTYRFQQIQLGIGVSYTRAIFQNWSLDLSLGGDFNFGHVRKLSGSSLFETPTVSKVGVSVYFRPAIEYHFGRYAILAFGRIDQPVVSQIKWSFLANRNPNFGGGIACRYYF